jgi:hypothetical protein
MMSSIGSAGAGLADCSSSATAGSQLERTLAQKTPVDMVVVILVGMGLLLRLAFLAEHFNQDWEPDGYKHVMMSKATFAALPGSLWYAVDVWAKPAYTLFYAVLYRVLPTSWPAIVITQVANSVMWTAASVLVLSLARSLFQNRYTLIVIAAFSAFAYVSFRASVSANTEPFGALVFAAGMLLLSKRYTTAAMFAFGSEILIRMDAVFCVSVFPLWVVARVLLERDAGLADRLWRSFRYGAAFALPLFVWNLAGFWHTGSPLFVLTNGYPTTAGIYGFGNVTYYAREFIHFDPLLFLSFLAGSILIVVRRQSELLMVFAVAALFYLVVMAVFWIMGAFGSAGLLRYFVFQYPLWLVIAGVAIEAVLTVLQRHARGWTGPIVAVVCLLSVAQLHWLVREPRWYNNVLTRVPDNQARNLPALVASLGPLPLYTDRPDILYYLGRDQFYGDSHPIATVRQKEQSGLFIFTQGWTEQYSGLTEKDFAGLREVAKLPGPWGEIFHVYVRQ